MANGQNNQVILNLKMGRLSFSLDNKRIILGLKEQEKIEKISRDTVANVDVWHWGDEQIQSVQMVRSPREQRSTYTGLLHIDQLKFIQLSSDDMRNVITNRNADKIIGGDPKPYIGDINPGGSETDYYIIDPQNGSKKLIIEKIGRSMGLSPDGNWFLWFKDGNFFSYNLVSKKLINVTGGMDVSFIDINEDHPYENPSYGMAGWSADGKTVLLNHLYDLWAVKLDGSGGYNLTGNYGSENEIKLRINSVDREPFVNLAEDIYLTAYGEWTKKSGYFKLKDGKAPVKLIFDDANFGRLSKASDADRFMFIRQTFVDFPDYYTCTKNFKNPAKCVLFDLNYLTK